MRLSKIFAVIAAGLIGSTVLAGSLSAAKPFEGQVINLHVWGGREGQMVRKHVIEPFEEETGAKVVVEEGWTSAGVAKLRAQKSGPKLDVLMIDDIGIITAGREGLLEPLDLGKLPNAKDIPENFVIEGNGVGFYVYVNSLAYAKEAFPTPPESWSVLWESSLKGKVIMPAIDSTSIYKVLMISSLMNGGSQANMDPGFEAMKRLKPNIHSLSKNTALIAESLRSGDASVAAWQVSIMKQYIEKGYPIGVTIQLDEGVFGTAGCAGIVKGHRAPRELLDRFINRALSVEAQRGFARDFWYSPTNRKVEIADDLKHIVLPAEGSPVKLVPVDLVAFHQRKAEMLDRLNKLFLQ
jgi:putative spermidine/putrescine transport system substrate-binding protein